MQKIADVSKIKRVLRLKVYFLNMYIGVYLCTKFQVSSIVLTNFRQVVILPPTPISKQTPKKPTQMLGVFFTTKLG